jgi:hypothetical protein
MANWVMGPIPFELCLGGMPRAPRLSKPADPLNLLAIIKVSSISDSGVALKKPQERQRRPATLFYCFFEIRFTLFCQHFLFSTKKNYSTGYPYIIAAGTLTALSATLFDYGRYLLAPGYLI